MRFLKSFFKSDPREIAKEKILELDIKNKAIYLPEAIGMVDEFHLVRDVAEELVSSGQLKGQLVGKKGWFLPQAEDKLTEVWSALEKGKVNLSEISTKWGLNEKRVFIAIENYASSKSLSEPVFHRKELDLYLMSYFKQAWMDMISSIDDEDPVEFSQLISKVQIPREDKAILEQYVREWIGDEDSSITLRNDGLVITKEMLPEMMVEYINNAWEEKKPLVTYDELADYFGISPRSAGKFLQKLIDTKQITDVTLWATDEMIKPQM